MIQRNNSDHLCRSNFTISKIRNCLPAPGLLHLKEATAKHGYTRGDKENLLESKTRSVSPTQGGQDDAS